MTPEQLEAHRVRFEQQGKYPELPKPKFSKKVDGVPTITVTEHEALMRAYVDADRAQRSVPGVQGGELPPITDEDREFLHDNPNTQDVVDWVRAYALSAVAAYQASQSMACAGPRCMHMPGRKGSMHSRECIEQAGLDQGWTPTAEELANAGPSYVTQSPQQSAQPVVVITVQRNAFVSASRLVGFDALPDGDHSLYATAQPVEVQRVPLTNGQVSEGQDNNGLFPGSVASCAFTMGVRFAESKHGIKPTSSEGGA